MDKAVERGNEWADTSVEFLVNMMFSDVICRGYEANETCEGEEKNFQVVQGTEFKPEAESVDTRALPTR
jgi:hypothetical protein